jgi:hypothetical protein
LNEIQVIRSIGIYNFSNVASDSTGNTKKGRCGVVSILEHIINSADADHHLDLTAEDIGKLPLFSNVRVLWLPNSNIL